MQIKSKVYVIISECGEYIMKGVPKARTIARIDDDKCQKRILTYKTRNIAQSTLDNCWVYNPKNIVFVVKEAESILNIL